MSAPTPYLTGPEHYREAQKILSDVNRMVDDDRSDEDIRLCIAVAQVHATLALAAATVTGALTDVAASGDIEVGPGTWHDILTGGAS